MDEENQKPDSNIKSTIEAATGLVKAIPVYQDAIQPSAKQIGKSLETITKAVNIALAPIKALVWGYEKIEEFISTRVAEKLKNVKEENITTPPPQVAGPAVEALRFSGHDENLRELFANLLATAMDKETVDKAHPGYVDIIRNLSPDEALLLNAFTSRTSYPIIEIHAKFKDASRGYTVLLTNYSHLHKIIAVKRPDLVPSYLNNLCRLGILEIPAGSHLTAEGMYDPLQNDDDLEKYKKQTDDMEDREFGFEKGLIRLSNFGQHFVENVVIEKR